MREDYLSYLRSVRNLSAHTLESYGKDLQKYEAFLEERAVDPRRGGTRGCARIRGLAHPGRAFPPVGQQDGVRGPRMVSLHGAPRADRRQSLRRNPQPAHGEAPPSFLFEEEMARLIEMPPRPPARERIVLEAAGQGGPGDPVFHGLPHLGARLPGPRGRRSEELNAPGSWAKAPRSATCSSGPRRCLRCGIHDVPFVTCALLRRRPGCRPGSSSSTSGAGGSPTGE